MQDSSSRHPPTDFIDSLELEPRYATLMFVLREASEGGQLVFPALDPVTALFDEREFHYGKPPTDCEDITAAINKGKSCVDKHDREQIRQYINQVEDQLTDQQQFITTKYLEGKKKTKAFPLGSYERKLMTICQSKFSMPTKRLEAVLFYSQTPQIVPDYLSMYGHCPVLGGETWIASMSIWNGPRFELWKVNEKTGLLERPKLMAVSASFESRDIRFAKLYWEDQVRQLNNQFVALD